MREALSLLSKGHDLSAERAQTALAQIVAGEANEAQLGAFLMGLRSKGETFEELLGCARALRDAAVSVRPSRGPLIDTCGTGGDGASTLNISTLAALTVAACGGVVAKHGNRSVSSRCGSADLLEQLGLPLLDDPRQMERCIDENGFGFLFAPYFHPATARVAPARKSLGIRTVFNLLGPVSNPARAHVQLIGVFAPEWLEPLARVAAELGVERCLVVHGAGGVDELTLAGPAQAVMWRDGRLQRLTLDAGLPRVPLSALSGGDPEQNAREALAILQGREGADSDTVALNAGACLMLAGMSEDLLGGFEQARQVLRSGTAFELLEKLRRWSG